MPPWPLYPTGGFSQLSAGGVLTPGGRFFAARIRLLIGRHRFWAVGLVIIFLPVYGSPREQALAAPLPPI